VFPEAFVPGYPVWVWFIPAGHTHPLREACAELVANAVTVPGADTDSLGAAMAPGCRRSPTAFPTRICSRWTALAARISAALGAMRDGGAALASAADVTPGAKKDFGSAGNAPLADFATAAYLGEEDVAGRGIRRHGGEVARVRLYRMQTQGGVRYLFVHLTSTGVVTDYDVTTR
jgi:hypothetical protein